MVISSFDARRRKADSLTSLQSDLHLERARPYEASILEFPELNWFL